MSNEATGSAVVNGSTPPAVVALAGGVGAARMLSGLVAVVDARSVVAVVNTGDDICLHGLRVSPDIDTVVYTLAGAVHQGQGWGLAADTWATMGALERYRAAAPAGSAAGATWFRLGDVDLATHLYRTGRLNEGAVLSDITAEISRAWGVDVRILPMSDDRVETRVTIVDEDEAAREVGFQEWFVGRACKPPVRQVRFAGAGASRAAPGVLDGLRTARRVVICPSNPLVSIAPALAVPGINDAVRMRREDVVAVSPIVGGAALKGPAAQLMSDLGHEPSVAGVARFYAPYAATLVVDKVDATLAPQVEAAGMRCVVAPAVMSGPAEAAALARVVIAGQRTTT